MAGLKAILVCSCSGMENYAINSYHIVSTGEDFTPDIYKGDQVRDLANGHQGTNLERYLRAVVKTLGKWAYYVESEDGENISKLYDLLTGRRVG